MILDKKTLDDLSFFQGNHSIFSIINCCTTQAGTDILRKWVLSPPSSYGELRKRQEATSFWIQHIHSWPQHISNGTLVMVEKFFEYADNFGGKESSINLFINSILQKVFNKNAYSFIRFSIAHLVDFLKGCHELVQLKKNEPPVFVKEDIEFIEEGLLHPLCQDLLNLKKEASQKRLIQLSYRAKKEIKQLVYKLMGRYARLDASQAMAKATVKEKWVLPSLLPAQSLHYEAHQLYHPLLQKPVAYDIAFSKEKNFLFLTGANMSGKSTLIRALGVAALLAHIGIGVPAASMKISFLEGVITNMQVEDNIFLGESYFFAEVQRMKLTAQKLSRHRHHLVLMDELFKGTNVHDAYECSRAVINGLLQQKDNLMALSTHLNELADNLKGNKAVWFRYCYTRISEDSNYEFTYQLKEGVSQDRIGFMVLKNEGVLDLLQKEKE